MVYKIAFASSDGVRVDSHFGSAERFYIVTLDTEKEEYDTGVESNLDTEMEAGKHGARKDDAGLDQRAGYYGQQLVLLAQKIGLNTCWTGTFNKKNIDADVPDGQRLVICIAIGYGADSGKPHKSKTAAQVSTSGEDMPEWFVKGVEMALLAPTAINQQKFMINLGPDDAVEFVDKGGVLSQVDIGIVKYNFEVGSGRKQTPGA